MARQTAYYIDPEEERRREELLAELGGGNLGVAPAPRIPLSPADLTTPRMTDRAYPPVDDAWNRAEPSPQDLAADAAAEEEADADVEAPETPKTLLSRNPYDDAPDAVDQRAASVSDAQKGTPATAVDLGWADELLAGVKQRMLDTPPLSQMDYSHAADQFIDPSTQKGERSDLLGFDDEEGFSRQKQIERARAAYGEDTPPSSRWEDEFLQNHKRISDADVQRSFILQALAGGQEAGLAFRESMLRQQAGQEEGLAKARERDRANTRIDRGLAEAIAATGNVSPEQAAQLTYGHPLVKAFSSGMYSQGGRAEGQALGLNKEKLNIISRLRQHIDNGDLKSAQAELSALTQLGVADLNRQGRQGQPTPDPTQDPNELRMRGAKLAKALGNQITPEQGMRAILGNTDGIPAEIVKQIDQKLPGLMASLDDPKVRPRVLQSDTTQDVTAPARKQYAIEQSLEIARNNPDKITKFKNDWYSAAVPLNEAYNAFQQMSPEGKAAFVEWGKGGWAGAIGNFLKTPEDRARGAKVQRAINAQVKADAGSAVTGSEWDRIAAGLQIEANTWNPFNTPQALEEYFQDAAKILELHRETFENEYGRW